MEPSREFWFNTKTNQVEVGPQSLSMDRIGPFTTHAEASRALEVIAERAKRIAEESEREDSWD